MRDKGNADLSEVVQVKRTKVDENRTRLHVVSERAELDLLSGLECRETCKKWTGGESAIRSV